MPKTTRSSYLDELNDATGCQILAPCLTAEQRPAPPEPGSRSSQGEFLNNLWIAVRVTLIAVTIYGLWRTSPSMRIAVMIAGLAALVILVAVLPFILYSVRKEPHQKGTGNGQRVTPIE